MLGSAPWVSENGKFYTINNVLCECYSSVLKIIIQLCISLWLFILSTNCLIMCAIKEIFIITKCIYICRISMIFFRKHSLLVHLCIKVDWYMSTPFLTKHQNKAKFKDLDDSEVLSSDFPVLRTSAASMTSTASFHQKTSILK